MPDIANQLEQFIREAFQVAEDDPGFNHHVDLFEAGYVDSVGVIETLGFITDTFNIEIPDSALLSDEFTTIDGMARTIVGLIEAQVPLPEPTAA
jgi:acyl carrier protein